MPLLGLYDSVGEATGMDKTGRGWESGLLARLLLLSEARRRLSAVLAPPCAPTPSLQAVPTGRTADLSPTATPTTSCHCRHALGWGAVGACCAWLGYRVGGQQGMVALGRSGHMDCPCFQLGLTAPPSTLPSTYSLWGSAHRPSPAAATAATCRSGRTRRRGWPWGRVLRRLESP